MSNFESSVKVIPYSQERVYNKLSDLSNLLKLEVPRLILASFLSICGFNWLKLQKKSAK